MNWSALGVIILILVNLTALAKSVWGRPKTLLEISDSCLQILQDVKEMKAKQEAMWRRLDEQRDKINELDKDIVDIRARCQERAKTKMSRFKCED